MPPEVSAGAVEGADKDVCERNGESCPRYNRKSLCYKDLHLLPFLRSKAWRRKHTDFMQRIYAIRWDV